MKCYLRQIRTRRDAKNNGVNLIWYKSTKTPIYLLEESSQSDTGNSYCRYIFSASSRSDAKRIAKIYNPSATFFR